MYDDFYEENPKERKLLKKKKVIVPIFLILTVIVIGTSYALWQLTFTQTGTNTITTGCLNLTLTDDTDEITLNEAVPMTDSEGKTLTPYTFTITNTCKTETNYVINLETVSEGDKILADKYIKANLVKGTSEVFLDKLLSSHINEDKVIESASAAYMLDQGTLKDKESVTYNLRLWIADDASDIEEMMNAIFASKITITATYTPPESKNIMVAMDVSEVSDTYVGAEFINNTYTQNDKYDISKVVFQSKKNPYTEAVEVVDFSEAQDKAILGYYVKNADSNNYTLYIQANGKILVNQVASYYGLTKTTCNHLDCLFYSSVEGIEVLDTSLVTDMSRMFAFTIAENINLDNFDTSNVEKITEMFWYFRTSGTLSLKNFNTSKVTNMSRMFLNCYASNLDLSGLNTSNVTNMSQMFSSCNSLTTINLSSFDTSNVTNMSQMFSSCNSLTTLDLSNFDTSNVTDMSQMFSSCDSLTTINLSSFDTSNVTNMSQMFLESKKIITTINIMNPNVIKYEYIFNSAATEEGAQIIINYTTETSNLVDQIIAQTSSNSNIIKGTLIQ